MRRLLATGLVLVGWMCGAATARDFMVGQSVDLSGLSNLGKDFSNGVHTYFDAVNARGGVRGRKVQFVQLDDSGRAADAQANVEKLLREHEIDVLIAPASEETLLAALKVLRQRALSIPIIGAPTGAVVDAAVVSPRPISVRASYREEARALLDSLRTFSDGGIALVRAEGPDALAAQTALRAEARVRQLPILFDGVTAAWLQRKPSSERIGAVIISGDAIGALPAIKHSRAIAPYALLLGFSTIDHRTLLELAGTQAAGMMITRVMPPPGKTIHSFQREHRAMMKLYRDEPPSQHTLEGYVVAHMLATALERVEGEPSPGKVDNALRAQPAVDFGPMRVDLRNSGISNRYVDITAISTKGGLVE